MPKEFFVGKRFEQSEQEEANTILARIEAPAKRLLERLRPNLDEAKYDSILGDDASARIHTLLLSKAIRDIYGEKKKLETVFVKGGRMLKSDKPFQGPSEYDEYIDSLSKKELAALDALQDEEFEEKTKHLSLEPRVRQTTHAAEVADYVARMKPLIGKRTLLVTEEILSGSSIDILVSMLRENGIEADVVSFGIAENEGVEDFTFTTPKGTPIMLGSLRFGDTIPKGYLGIVDSRIYDLRSGRGHSVRIPSTNKEREQVLAMRKAVRDMGSRLAQEYLKEKF